MPPFGRSNLILLLPCFTVLCCYCMSVNVVYVCCNAGRSKFLLPLDRGGGQAEGSCFLDLHINFISLQLCISYLRLTIVVSLLYL